MKKDEAENLVKPMIKGSTITKTEDFGELYAVYFVNDEYYKSQKFEDMMVGAGPMMVEKSTGEIFETGSAQSGADYAKSYNECGSVYGKPSEKILISKLSNTENSKTIIIKIKSILNIKTQESKRMVESLIKNEAVEIVCNTAEEAETSVNNLQTIGVLAKQIWEPLC